MTFSTPQAQDSPTFPAQALTDATDLAAVQAAGAGSVGSGVVSGCAVTPHSSGVDLNVNVASGSVIVAGATVAVSAATNVTVAAASTHDRRDIVTVNSSGTVSVTTGTACSVAGWTTGSGVLGPVKPAIPASSVLLAEVYVPGAATSITASNIVAKAAPIGTSAPTVKTYSTGTVTTIASTTSSTMADCDATNLVITCVVPASGNLIVTLHAICLSSAGDYYWWGLREGTTDIADQAGNTKHHTQANPNTCSSTVVMYLTGLTPGSHTYKWSHAVNSGTGSMTAGSTRGTAIMVVQPA